MVMKIAQIALGEVVIYLEQLSALAVLSPFPTLGTHKRIENPVRWPVK